MIFKSDAPDTTSYMLMPLRDIVVFPYMVASLYVGRQSSIRVVETAAEQNRKLFLCTQKDPAIDNPSLETLYRIGTIASVLQTATMPDGRIKVLIEGISRAEMKRIFFEEETISALVNTIKQPAKAPPETTAYMKLVVHCFEEYFKLIKQDEKDLISKIGAITDPFMFADLLAPRLNIKVEEKQGLLETLDVCKRLEKIYFHIESQLEFLRIEKRIKAQVKKQIEKNQKDYYLSEQMRAIQKELGGGKEELANDISDMQKKAASKQLSPEAKSRVEKEIKKLKAMPPMSAEITVARHYLDWILSLPWGKHSEEKLDIETAEKTLNQDHHALDEPKRRIVEYLAVLSLVKKIKGPILCFVGPPGVGKTSLGRSIARATGRRFVRMALGGVRDEAEIRGHRRTYIGALPGKILQGLKKAGTDNPVFLLDEIDKMSNDFRGDPSAALLEVLDPEQNCAFNDHYIDMDYDLSHVMFITTANTLQNIPPALQDRMEIIRIPGYTEREKLEIAQHFLVKKQVEGNGLQNSEIDFTDESILTIIRKYTREAGVRSLEREIASLCRKIAVDAVKGALAQTVTIEGCDVQERLGVPKFRYEKAEEQDRVGITTGLGWTETGGDILFFEVVLMPGKGNLVVTGKLGDVMKESAQAAMSYVRSRAKTFAVAQDFYKELDIHIHVPEGATPKDGPSAGIAITTSIVSALTRLKVRRDLAMTGEITLRGRVLPVGGLKEKIFAAHRGLISTVIIPKENRKDLKDIPEEILNDLTIITVDHMDEVLKTAIVDDGEDSFLKTDLFINGVFQDSGAPLYSVN